MADGSISVETPSQEKADSKDFCLRCPYRRVFDFRHLELLYISDIRRMYCNPECCTESVSGVLPTYVLYV